MSKKLKFPVAKVRDDGTPAIWLTHSNWLLLKPGMVREYLDRRESLGRYKARTEARRRLGADWRQQPHLKSWECLDTLPFWSSDAAAVLELFTVGYEAWKHVKGLGLKDWTPESLVAAGDRYEARGLEAELRLLAPEREVAA